MKLDREQVRALAGAVDLPIPEEELESVTIRLATLLAQMDRIEVELGEEMNAVEPVPPVFPREDF